jgi:XTP/dITP diphosphohydrolase
MSTQRRIKKMPFLSSKKMVIASHNAGKVREIAALLAPLKIEVISAAALQLAEPEETGDSFHANAALKSRAAAAVSGLPALADDSGLVIPALDGAPGIFSARWAGETKDFSFAMQRIERELREKGIQPEGADASFICVLSLALPDGTEHAFAGEIAGNLTFPPRGTHGFGYDPLFIATGYNQTFAEIPAEEKHRISHRAHAFQKLTQFLEDISKDI